MNCVGFEKHQLSGVETSLIGIMSTEEKKQEVFSNLQGKIF